MTVNSLAGAVQRQLETQVSSSGLRVALLQPTVDMNRDPGWLTDMIRDCGLPQAVMATRGDDGQGHAVIAAPAALTDMFGLRYAMGGSLTESDELYGAAAAVVGNGLWEAAARPAVGATITIAGRPFRLRGVLAADAGNVYLDLDETAFVLPGWVDGGQREYYMIPGPEPLRPWLDSRLGAHNYVLLDQRAMLEATGRIAAGLRFAMVAISLAAAAVALLGMVGQALAELPSQQAAIGLQKALGARRTDIMWSYFIRNALILAMSAALGWGGFSAVAVIAQQAGLDMQSAQASNLGLTILVMGVGLAAGLVPARRASRITVMQALRQRD